MTKTLSLANGQVLLVRAPSREEIERFLDKRQISSAGDRVSHDACDDGDNELQACVKSPAAAQVEELLEDFPLANRHLQRAVLELAWAGKVPPVRNDALLTAEHQRLGKRLVGFSFDGQTLVLSKISRFEMKRLEHDTAEAGHHFPLPSAVSALAEQHLLAPVAPAAKQIFAACPALGARLGAELMEAARVALVAELGESAAATKPPEGSPSTSETSSS